MIKIVAILLTLTLLTLHVECLPLSEPEPGEEGDADELGKSVSYHALRHNSDRSLTYMSTEDRGLSFYGWKSSRKRRRCRRGRRRCRRIKICHIFPRNPPNFRSMNVAQRAWPRLKARGDLRGSCDAHCQALCFDGDVCSRPEEEHKSCKKCCLSQVNSQTLPTQPPSQPPTVRPTVSPTSPPSQPPTVQPTDSPTFPPSIPPSLPPTVSPTTPPSKPPTAQPTEQPTTPPSKSPTAQPTEQPTTPPSMPPTVQPTEQPTILPSMSPTEQPTTPPSMPPTAQPTEPPTTPPSEPPSLPPVELSEWDILTARKFPLPDGTTANVDVVSNIDGAIRLMLSDEDGKSLVQSVISSTSIEMNFFQGTIDGKDPVINLELDPPGNEPTEGTAIMVTRFITVQVWDFLTQEPGAPRRLNEPGCDDPALDTCCSLPCCADHDHCYYHDPAPGAKPCTKASWFGLESVHCFLCNLKVVWCYLTLKGCRRASEWDPRGNCYDDQCDTFFDCPIRRSKCSCSCKQEGFICKYDGKCCGDGTHCTEKCGCISLNERCCFRFPQEKGVPQDKDKDCRCNFGGKDCGDDKLKCCRNSDYSSVCKPKDECCPTEECGRGDGSCCPKDEQCVDRKCKLPCNKGGSYCPDEGKCCKEGCNSIVTAEGVEVCPEELCSNGGSVCSSTQKCCTSIRRCISKSSCCPEEKCGNGGSCCSGGPEKMMCCKNGCVPGDCCPEDTCGNGGQCCPEGKVCCTRGCSEPGDPCCGCGPDQTCCNSPFCSREGGPGCCDRSTLVCGYRFCSCS